MAYQWCKSTILDNTSMDLSYHTTSDDDSGGVREDHHFNPFYEKHTVHGNLWDKKY